MNKLFSVDGSGHIFRAYYAVHQLATRSGFPTNALLGFTRMVLKLIRDEAIAHIAITFDTGAKTFRHKMFEPYKANRAECPADLVPQMPYFRSITAALGLPTLEQEGFEADDIIGTLAKRFASADTRVIIVSGDKDLTQLVTDKIEVWDAMRDVHFTPPVVLEKFGVSPERIVDYLTLVGDTSDNVPGLKGVGPKTAEQLLKHFNSIEEMIENAARIESIAGIRGAAKIKETILQNPAALRLSKQLVTIDCNVRPYTEISDLETFAWKGVNTDLAKPLFEELEFTSLLADVPGIEVEAPEKRDFTIVNRENLQSIAAELGAQLDFAIDTETTALNPAKAELVGISLAWCKGGDARGFYLPLICDKDADCALNIETVREFFGPILADPKIKKCGANLKFDLAVLEQHGFTLNGQLFDTMLASYVLFPDTRQHGLKSLARSILKIEMQTYEQVVGEAEHLGLVPLAQTARYAAEDATVSLQLTKILSEKLNSSPREKYVFEQIEMPLVPVLAAMERAGILVDSELLTELGREFARDLEDLEREIQQLAGTSFNLNSPKQLSEVLFEKLKLPTKGVRKTTHGFSTDANVLAALEHDYEIARKLSKYRELFKLKTTYVDALLRLRDSETGRIHTSFNQAVAATGRLSSSDPNLQNIPIRYAAGRRIRETFIAAQECVLISADYSQIELRVLAHLSKDECLQRAFFAGQDIHLATACELFGELALYDADKDNLRRVAKTINFGIVYGMGAPRLARDLNISRAQAQEYIDRYFARYPRVSKYFAELTEQIQTLGYVETLHGRRRYLKDIDTSGRDDGYAARSLMNAPLQGSAAEIIKLAMIQLHSQLKEKIGKEHTDAARMVLQVHDELVFEVQKNLVDTVTEMITKTMESAVALSVPLKVDVRSGKSWGKT